ncbi:cytochrome P450 [Colletotrichum cereale]|nr:cytochrome P450 [Colletotrichum cereale]
MATIKITLYIASYIVYNLFFHPLRRFPGPLLMRATRAADCYRHWRGDLSFYVLELHRRHGDVVRIAPNELAFADPSAWKEVMGHRTGGGVNGGKAPPEFEKMEVFYRPIADLPRDIITTRGPEHAMLRRQLSHGFSDRSLREHEPVIMRYVEHFIQRMREAIKGRDLAFGESFGCLEEEKLHSWVRTFFMMIKAGVALQTASHFPVLRRLITAAMERRLQHQDMTMQKLVRRIELGEREGPRADLIEGLLRKKEEWNLSLTQLDGNTSILIIAGSETTATLLSGVTYLLLKNPEKMRKLVREVRTAFKREEEITLASVNALAYMLACLDEALRMVVPEGGATVSGEFVPGKMTVSIHHWAMYHNKKNFKNPFVFHPERFLGDPEYASDRREAFQPFHLGPRKRLGKNLAYVEMRIVLARLLWNFDLELAEDSERWMDDQKIYTLWEKGPLNVYLRAR